MFGKGVSPRGAVSKILEDIQDEGDKALRYWSKLLDRFEIDDFRISPEAIEAAYDDLAPN